MPAYLRSDRERLVADHPELTDWRNYMDLEGATATTQENYMYTAVRFVERTGKSLLEASSSEVLDFLRALPPASRKTRRAHFSSFYEWAELNDLIVSSPMKRVPKIKQTTRKTIDVFEPWEQAALIAEDAGRMAIMLYCGLRLGEASALQGRDVDLSLNRLIVRRGKGGGGRVVKMGGVATAHVVDMLLLEGIGDDDTIWFCRPGGGRIRRRDIGESAFRAWWSGCLASAGVRYRKPHTTRHTFATNALRAGVRIERLQKMMGHKSIQTTLDLYGHLTEQDIESDMDLFDRSLRETVEVSA